MLAVVAGGYLAAAALSTPAGPPLSVGGIATVQPLSGWRFVQRVEEAGVPGVVITRGVGSFELLAAPTDQSPAELARSYATEVLEAQASQLQVSDSLDAVTLDSGAAVRFYYIGVFDQSGVPLEGEVTVAVSSAGNGVIFDAWAPEGQLQYVLGDVETMVDAAEIS